MIQKTHFEMMKQVNDALGIEGQSSEDSDSEHDPNSNQPAALLVSIPHSRRRIISQLLYDLDNDIDRHRSQSLRSRGKRIIPKPTRIRKRTDNISYRTVKHGLPRALYHRRYLAGLVPSALVAVKPQEIQIPRFTLMADAHESDSSGMDED